jgi:hypothetical protein
LQIDCALKIHFASYFAGQHALDVYASNVLVGLSDDRRLRAQDRGSGHFLGNSLMRVAHARPRFGNDNDARGADLDRSSAVQAQLETRLSSAAPPHAWRHRVIKYFYCSTKFPRRLTRVTGLR